MNFSKLQEIVKDREALRAAVHNSQKLDMTWQLNKNNNTIGKFTDQSKACVFHLPELVKQSTAMFSS